MLMISRVVVRSAEKGGCKLRERSYLSGRKVAPFLGPSAWSLPTMQRYNILEGHFSMIKHPFLFFPVFSYHFPLFAIYINIELMHNPRHDIRPEDSPRTQPQLIEFLHMRFHPVSQCGGCHSGSVGQFFSCH